MYFHTVIAYQLIYYYSHVCLYLCVFIQLNVNTCLSVVKRWLFRRYLRRIFRYVQPLCVWTISWFFFRLFYTVYQLLAFNVTLWDNGQSMGEINRFNFLIIPTLYGESGWSFATISRPDNRKWPKFAWSLLATVNLVIHWNWPTCWIG